MKNAADFVYEQTKAMANKLEATDHQSEMAARDARSEYKRSAVIKGGVSSMIERYAKQADKNSKKEEKRGA